MVITQSGAGWGIDRQFRLTLGLLLWIFLLSYLLSASPYVFIIPAIVFAGLIYSAVTDKCYLRIGISRLPWNRVAETRRLETRPRISNQGANSNVQS
ncbi:MAG: hypothetical protein R2856_27770 [Caldilineaceae bacterium]